MNTIRSFHSEILELVKEGDYRNSYLILTNNLEKEEIKVDILKIILNEEFPVEKSLGKVGFYISKVNQRNLINSLSEIEQLISYIRAIELPDTSCELRMTVNTKIVKFLICPK